MKYILKTFFIIFIPSIFSGCACYHGYRDYEVTKPLSRKGETLVMEKHNIVNKDGNITVQRFRRYEYEQTYRVYTVREMLYNEFTYELSLIHIISYPFSLVFSPLVPMGKDREIREAGYVYTYTKGRRFWNWINPFICTVGDNHKFEINVMSHNDHKCTEYREENCIVDGVNIDIILPDGRKLIRPVGVSTLSLCKDVFDYPLPEKAENVVIKYRDAILKITVNSTASLPGDQYKKWNTFLNMSDTTAHRQYHDFKHMLDNLAEQKIISKDTFDANLSRLNEQRLRILKAKEKEYRLLAADLDRLYMLSKKQKLTDDEYEQTLECSKRILSENCADIINQLEDGKIISSEIALKHKSTIRYAENAIAYPCRNYKGIYLDGGFYTGVSRMHLSKRTGDISKFDFTTINGWDVACGTSTKVYSSKSLNAAKKHCLSKFSNLHVRDRSSGDHPLHMPEANFLMTASCSYRNYDIVMENEKVIITITGNLAKAEIDTVMPDECLSTITKYEMKRAQESLKQLAEKLMQKRGIENVVTITIVDKKLKRLGY